MEHKLFLSVDFAVRFGLNAAIVIQDVHYWLTKSGKKRDNGQWWIYNSISKFQTHFPFWGEATVKRALKTAEHTGLVMREDAGLMGSWWGIMGYSPSEHREPTLLLPSNDGRISSFYPTVAQARGSISQAVILNHVFYRCGGDDPTRKPKKDGHIWIPFSLEDAHRQLPYINPRTLRRDIEKLVDDGWLFETCRWNKDRFDRTRWLRVDHSKLPEGKNHMDKLNEEIGQALVSQ